MTCLAFLNLGALLIDAFKDLLVCLVTLLPRIHDVRTMIVRARDRISWRFNPGTQLFNCGLVTIGSAFPLWMYDHEKNLCVGAAVLGMGTIVSLPSV
jgi:hypothetical protein